MAQQESLRPLYLVNELVSAAGHEITYAYDDLAFISHSEILVQFSDEEVEALWFYIHQDLDPEKCEAIRARYEIIAGEQSLKLTYRGRFAMDSNKETSEIDLRFFPA